MCQPSMFPCSGHMEAIEAARHLFQVRRGDPAIGGDSCGDAPPHGYAEATPIPLNAGRDRKGKLWN